MKGVIRLVLAVGGVLWAQFWAGTLSGAERQNGSTSAVQVEKRPLTPAERLRRPPALAD